MALFKILARRGEKSMFPARQDALRHQKALREAGLADRKWGKRGAQPGTGALEGGAWQEEHAAQKTSPSGPFSLEGLPILEPLPPGVEQVLRAGSAWSLLLAAESSPSAMETCPGWGCKTPGSSPYRPADHPMAR